jgi:hypothetical protein
MDEGGEGTDSDGDGGEGTSGNSDSREDTDSNGNGKGKGCFDSNEYGIIVEGGCGLAGEGSRLSLSLLLRTASLLNNGTYCCFSATEVLASLR